MTFIEKITSFINNANTGTIGEYKMWQGGEVNLYASCFAAMTLHYLNALENYTALEKKKWADYINGWQDNTSGLFIGPELFLEELTSPKHDFEHVSMHLTAHALPALSLLGSTPKHKLHFAHRFLDRNELIKWLTARDWSRAWLEGNNLLFIGQFLIHLRDVEGVKEAAPALNMYFDWLDSQVDPATGLWGTNGHCSSFVAMCGAYHQLLVYYYENREVSYKERLVDTVLSLQHQDGGFSPNGGGGACEDVDAADILVNLYKQLDYRRPDIRAALRRLLESLLQKQMADGGFVYRLDEPFLYMGIKKTYCPANESNMFSTWFRVHTLALINEILDEKEIAGVKWKFNDTCSMGWHRSWDKRQALTEGL